MAAVNNNSKLYIRILLIFIAVVLVMVTAALFVIPAVYENDCKTRVYEDLEKRMDPVLSANICIVRREETTHGNVTEYSYSTGASGVIFDKKYGIYYALTANHVVENSNSSVKASFIVQPYGTQPYSQNDTAFNSSLVEYYSKFPTAKVEYIDEKSDLAVISFYISEDLEVLPLAEADASNGDRIAVVSNPDGKRFVHSFGKVLSGEQIVFSAGDGKSDNMTIQHSAYTAPGSSGSAVLNENMEIVGVNIGGATDFMGRYRYSAMIPRRQIKLFLDNWRLS